MHMCILMSVLFIVHRLEPQCKAWWVRRFNNVHYYRYLSRDRICSHHYCLRVVHTASV